MTIPPAAVIQKFRKKPVVIEAIQFDGENASDILSWAHRNTDPMMNAIIRRIDGLNQGCLLQIRTLEGDMFAIPGDWISKGSKGEFYPVKPEIFKELYEPIE